jgi:hypothetical protein
MAKNSLEKIYLFKNVGIPEYYLGGNVEFQRLVASRLGIRVSS